MTSPNEPTMVEALSQALDESAGRIMVAAPGKVAEWSRTTQTAKIRPLVLKPDGTERAVTIYMPVIFPGVYWDIQVGEVGLLVMADQDWHIWWRTDEVSLPETTASHDIQNAFFIPGLRSRHGSRDLAAGSSVLLRPTAGGTVRLGAHDASKAALHEDLLTDLNSFLADLSAWVADVDGAAGPFLSTAPLQAEIAALIAGIGASSYQSPSVKVED
jgi:hypothetical protein